MHNNIYFKNNTLKTIIKYLICIIFFLCTNGCNSGSTQTSSKPVIPTLNQTAFNFIFVPSFEGNSATNNLSVNGLNHSLLFGQLLYQVTANKINGIYALDPFANVINNIPDFKPIQSIENYALLNAYGITANVPAIPSEVESIIITILQNSSYGTVTNGNYVFALPQELINTVLSDLSIYSNYALKFVYTPITNNHQYAVLSLLDMAHINENIYNDDISTNNLYPELQLPKAVKCEAAAVTIHNSTPPPTNINKNEVVYLVRHVEAHPGGSSANPENLWGLDNGNYACQGQWRAIASSSILLDKMNKILPDYVYSSDPSDTYMQNFPFTYVRPSLTISPFTIKYSIPLNLIENNNFSWDQPNKMAEYFFTNGQFNNKHILIAWEHDNIVKAINILFKNIYKDNNAISQIPNWPSNDYDTIWKLELNQNGDITFSNTCEGIPTPSLPMACPNF